jgi:hypothetical protein
MKQTILVKITADMLQADYMSNTDCPMARGLKAMGFVDVGIGGTYARIEHKGKTIASYGFPNHWTNSYVERKRKLGKDITVTITKLDSPDDWVSYR